MWGTRGHGYRKTLVKVVKAFLEEEECGRMMERNQTVRDESTRSSDGLEALVAKWTAWRGACADVIVHEQRAGAVGCVTKEGYETKQCKDTEKRGRPKLTQTTDRERETKHRDRGRDRNSQKLHRISQAVPSRLPPPSAPHAALAP